MKDYLKKLRKKYVIIFIKNIFNFVKLRNLKIYFSGIIEKKLNIIFLYIRCEFKRYWIWNYKMGMLEL